MAIIYGEPRFKERAKVWSLAKKLNEKVVTAAEFFRQKASYSCFLFMFGLLKIW
ncbi:MAG: hypothetical protein QW589_03560 [Candidatus Bathyarchaeia archaeon]